MRSLALLGAVVSVALLGGCAAEPASELPTPGGSAPVASAPQSEATSKESAPAAEGEEYVPNHIIMGKNGVRVIPDVQCSIYDENTISISGSGALDSEIEFAFDVFDGDSRLLRVQFADGEEWISGDTLSVRIETETRVTGLTDLISQTTGDSLPVSFAFTCE